LTLKCQGGGPTSKVLPYNGLVSWRLAIQAAIDGLPAFGYSWPRSILPWEQPPSEQQRRGDIRAGGL
jgi:hypothetical protein